MNQLIEAPNVYPKVKLFFKKHYYAISKQYMKVRKKEIILCKDLMM